jgi:hypothetical protein
LEQASKMATHWADNFDIKSKGKPRGIKGCGTALMRFVAHLEFAARAGGGDWTLNKNAESGTLIDALELLRTNLPAGFLPQKGKHPYQSYQKIVSHARSEWTRSSVSASMLSFLKGVLAKMDRK